MVAEAIGTALLFAIVVGSGIMGERLAQGNTAIALLANSIATGAGLYDFDRHLWACFWARTSIRWFPAVSVYGRTNLDATGLQFTRWRKFAAHFVGVVAAHAMFGLQIVQVSAHVRSTLGEGFGEVIATFGLVLGDFTYFAVSR